MSPWSALAPSLVNNIDPTGHSFWKKLWGGIKAVVKAFFNFQIPGLGDGVVEGDFSKFSHQAVNIGLSALFSGGNPIVIASSHWTSRLLGTKTGKKLTRSLANEVYDDILGFSPRTAYMLAYLDLSTTGNYAFERSFAHLTAERGAVVDFNKDFQPHRDLIESERYGYDSFGDHPTNPDKSWVANETQRLKVVTGKNGKMALVGESKYHLGSVHTGANSPNFSKALNMKYPSNVPRSLQQITFGCCHQATNATLLASGFSNVVTQTSGNYSTYVTTFVYGNYGGGLVQKTNSAREASRNWENGSQ